MTNRDRDPLWEIGRNDPCWCGAPPKYDGYVAGIWRAVDGTIEVTVFEKLLTADWDGIEHEAARLQELIADRDPNVYGRFGHWWDKAQLTPTRIFD